jgi:hypothetical protein
MPSLPAQEPRLILRSIRYDIVSPKPSDQIGPPDPHVRYPTWPVVEAVSTPVWNARHHPPLPYVPPRVSAISTVIHAAGRTRIDVCEGPDLPGPVTRARAVVSVSAFAAALVRVEAWCGRLGGAGIGDTSWYGDLPIAVGVEALHVTTDSEGAR